MSTPSDKTLRLERTKLTPQAPKGRNTTLIMAIVAGLAAAVLAYIWIKSQTPKPTPVALVAPVAPAPVPVVDVIQATQDMPARTPITGPMIKYVSIPKPQVPVNAMQNSGQVLNMIAVLPIKAGQTFISGMLAPNQYPVVGLTGLVKPGYRAITINLDSQTSVAGFLKPGDHVDILGTFDAGHGRTITRTVLQNVELLATGAQVIETTPVAPAPTNNGPLGTTNNDTKQNPDNENPTSPKPAEIPNATLLIRPVDAEKLVMSQAKGRLSITLRGNMEAGTTAIPMIESSTITTQRIEEAPRPIVVPPAPVMPAMNVAAPAPRTNSITVIRGSDARQVTVGM